MSKRLFLPCLVALVFPAAALAQGQEHLAPPLPPFLAAMPDNSTWTTVVTNSGTTGKLPSGGRDVIQYVNTKVGQNRELTSTWTDGTKSDLFFWDGYRLEQKPGSKVVMVSRLMGRHDFQDVDFPDLNWLKTTNYIEVEDQDGHDCYFFKSLVKIEVLHAMVSYSAYIDVKTKRPVAWSVGSNHFKLKSFALRNADAPFLLPEALASQLNAYRRAAEAADPYKKP